jgi:tRNA-Thr(GGU) m(6)t(6)A37 methyltransferase TsaA
MYTRLSARVRVIMAAAVQAALADALARAARECEEPAKTLLRDARIEVKRTPLRRVARRGHFFCATPHERARQAGRSERDGDAAGEALIAALRRVAPEWAVTCDATSSEGGFVNLRLRAPWDALWVEAEAAAAARRRDARQRPLAPSQTQLVRDGGDEAEMVEEEEEAEAKVGAASVKRARVNASAPVAAAAAAAAAPPRGAFAMSPVAVVESCFEEKHGTPRQSLLAGAARGRLVLSERQHVQALEGLEEFSHAWLVFVFHRNAQRAYHSKIHPPRLGGRKVGVFASRSPHRPNAIGLSVVRIERVAPPFLYVSGLDLVSGTPVLDIKPYHPADAIAAQLLRLPAWLRDAPAAAMEVRFTPRAEADLARAVAVGATRFLESASQLRAVITDTLSQDPRTLHSRRRHPPGTLYGFALDGCDVVFASGAGAWLVVEAVLPRLPAAPPRPQLRTRAWVRWVCEQLGRAPPREGGAEEEEGEEEEEEREEEEGEGAAEETRAGGS